VTECNRKPLVFSRVSRRKVQADFAGGTPTSDGGALLLREVDRRLGLIDQLADCLTDPRDPAKIQHDQRTMPAQRIFGIALGYEDLNDHSQLRHDPLFSALAEKAPQPGAALASAPTLCRLENRIARQALAKLSGVFVEQFIASFDKPPAELILDFDPTDVPLHGSQERRFFHGYYDHYRFLPLYVFCGHQLLVAYLRPGNIDASLHARAVLRLLVNRLRAAWPHVRILLRGDSSFARGKLMHWCEKNRVDYVIGLARNEVLKSMAEPFMEAAEVEYQKTRQKVRNFHDLAYAAETWDRERRVIAKAEHPPEGSNPRFVVTSLTDQCPHCVYDGTYVLRGDMEKRIKEQQLMLFANRASCHRFLANQFRLLLSGAAYVLVETLRRTALAGTEPASAQVNTIRLKLFKVAARVLISVRRVVLHLSTAYPLQVVFRQIQHRLCTTGPAT
jgi:hypothetical protein